VGIHQATINANATLQTTQNIAGRIALPKSLESSKFFPSSQTLAQYPQNVRSLHLRRVVKVLAQQGTATMMMETVVLTKTRPRTSMYARTLFNYQYARHDDTTKPPTL
jgi:hypothetical protein